MLWCSCISRPKRHSTKRALIHPTHPCSLSIRTQFQFCSIYVIWFHLLEHWQFWITCFEVFRVLSSLHQYWFYIDYLIIYYIEFLFCCFKYYNVYYFVQVCHVWPLPTSTQSGSARARWSAPHLPCCLSHGMGHIEPLPREMCVKNA